MYKSPITIIQEQFTSDIKMTLEDDILKGVMKYEIIVDKDELIKALKYDRDQYDKGYLDGRKQGIKDACEILKSEISQKEDYYFNQPVTEWDFCRGLSFAIRIIEDLEKR